MCVDGCVDCVVWVDWCGCDVVVVWLVVWFCCDVWCDCDVWDYYV